MDRTVRDIIANYIVCLGFHDTIHKIFLMIITISPSCVQVSDEDFQIFSIAEGLS